jgi:DNA-binding MarR family transcriptional regulator
MSTEMNPTDCNCLALRQAARHVTQLYDQHLASTGIRTTQFSVLSRLRREGPMSINALAADLVMDRTTLGRNIQPLERDGLVAVAPGSKDRRRKELQLTDEGIRKLDAAAAGWAKAQSEFEQAFGSGRASELRDLLRAVVATSAGGV